MKQAVILAGGKGTRLQERLRGLPKPLIDICGKPLLARQIELLKQFEYEEVLILVNHAAQQIIDFCNSHENWGIDIQCIDDGQPLGTAGSVINILPRLEDDFLVVYGDTMLDVDLDRFLSFHEENKGAGASLFLHPNDHPHDSDLVDVQDGDVIKGFYPYPHDPDQYLPNLVNAGLYFFRKTALSPWAGNTALLDFGKDIFPQLISKDVLLRGYNSPEYIKDCGTPKRLDKVCTDFQSGRIAASNLRVKQSLVFVDRDGVINKSVDQLSRAEQFELLPGVTKGISALNHSLYRSVLVTNQPVIARGECTFEELERTHRKMETLLGQEGAYFDRIYFCPHHPDKGFADEVPELKVRCACRKPEPGMLEQGLKDLNGDPQSSWMIGDSSADLLAARNAGVHSILVETGNAGLDAKYFVLPDYVLPDLYSATQFILNQYPSLLRSIGSKAESIKPGDFVFIGGQSRSGKSTIASCLKDALRLRGIDAVVLSVDGWLKAPEERKSGVLGRYDLEKLGNFLSSLLERQHEMTIELPIYNKLKLASIGHIKEKLKPNTVVIVEGTIALMTGSELPQSLRHQWYVEVSEGLRKTRLLREYLLRGKTVNEAEQIYAARLADEFSVISQSRGNADHIIHLELSSISSES